MHSLTCIAFLAVFAGYSLAQRHGDRSSERYGGYHGRQQNHGGRPHGRFEEKHSGERPQPPRPHKPTDSRPNEPTAPVAPVVPVVPATRRPNGGPFTTNNSKCGLPNVFPSGKLVVDWKSKDGLLYEYDVLDTPGLPTDPQEVNTMAKETLMGYVCLPGANAPVANVIREYSFVEVAQDGTIECVGHFVQSFASASGQQNMSVFDSSTATTSRKLAYFQIYDNPSTLGIRYSCKQANLVTGICDTPKVIVDIRKRPDQLTDAEKIDYDAKINTILAPYCISTATENFEKSTFRADLFPCAPPASPTFSALLQQIKANYPDGNTCGGANASVAGRSKQNAPSRRN